MSEPLWMEMQFAWEWGGVLGVVDATLHRLKIPMCLWRPLCDRCDDKVYRRVEEEYADPA